MTWVNVSEYGQWEDRMRPLLAPRYGGAAVLLLWQDALPEL